MKRSLLFPILMIAGICLAFVSGTVDDPFDALLSKMKAYNQKHAQEKVHLHLDKPYYAIGDDIWFKAYVTNTETLEPSDISKILYVELINERDSIKKQLKLPLAGGISWGDFKLPDSLTEGNYRIRAYTQWMRNAGPEFFFDKRIKIGNSWANRVFTNTTYSFSKENTAEKVNAKIRFTDKDGSPYAAAELKYEIQLDVKTLFKGKAVTDQNGEVNINFLNTQPNLYKSGRIIASIQLADKKIIRKEIPITATSSRIDVQFFPESGNIVENLPNKIGIKAVNAAGLGENVSGAIIDENGSEVSTFNTKNLGMGNFVLNPQPGKTYRAKLKFADGSEQTMDLPRVQPSGYIISINNTDKEKAVIKIMMSADLVGTKELKLVAQHSSSVYFTSRANSSRQVIVTSMPKKDLPSGIIQFTLFSADNQPIAERLAFINNPLDKIDAKIETEKQVYAKRENVKLNLSSAFDGKPVQGSFSMSVTNTATVKPDPDNESNILTTMLLTSDLIGYIEKPNSYFLNDDQESVQNLDNLMLTQGWRRVLWKNVINNLEPIIRFEPEKATKISGTITSYGGKPSVKSKVSLFSSSGGFFAIDTLTDDQGRFSFDNMVFTEDTKFIVQARTAKDKKSVDIRLDITPGQVVTRNINTGDVEVNVNEALSGYLKKSLNYFDVLTKQGLLEKTLMLDEVKIVEQKKNPNSSNLNNSHADAVITADQLTTCATLEQCLQGRVAGLQIVNGIAYLSRNGGRTPMQIYLDGMNMGPEFLSNISPSDIETIEILKSISNTAIYGMNGAGGIILLTTKRGGGVLNSSFTPGIITYNPKGYYISREFYSPKYSPAETDNRQDLRSTVYWNPQLITDTNGKLAINYFNTDQAGTYRVVLEGMDIFGHLARTVYTYEVK